MTKISQNLGGGLENGYKIFELFFENRFFSIFIKFFFRNHKIIKKFKCLFLLKLGELN